MSDAGLTEEEAAELFAEAILSASKKPKPKFGADEDDPTTAGSTSPFAELPLTWSAEQLP